MLPLNIQKMILDKLGLKNVSARDCRYIGSKLDASETTVKRFFGLIAESESSRKHFSSTLNRVAEFLGYNNYRELCVAVETFQNKSEEIPSIQKLNIVSLNEGSEIKLSHSQEGVIVMTYVGNGEFMVKETKDFRLFQGDLVRIRVEKAS